MEKLNRYSAKVTQSPKRSGARAMLHGAGFTRADLSKAQIAVVSNWYEGNPCNMHLGDLAQRVKESVADERFVALRLHTIGISDGISMGTYGMKNSLPSREVIADSIEAMAGAHWYDGCVAIAGCDKNIPAALIALLRINRPGLIFYGGTIKPGYHSQWGRLDIVSAFQGYGSYLAGQITQEELEQIELHACPGPGACGGMYTANTMACAIEAMGMALPYFSSTPAEEKLLNDECHQIAGTIKRLVELDLKPRDIISTASLKNAVVLTAALGGSTNAVLHLLAIAHSANLRFGLDDFHRICREVPYLADLKPSGQYLMEDLHKIGGIPAVMKLLIDQGLMDGSCMTITGQSLAENLEGLAALSADQEIIQPVDRPLKKDGHIYILRGNLAPDGAVAKITGKEGSYFNGRAIVFDSEDQMLDALAAGKIHKGHVVVIRYVGPKGGPGMPEMLAPTSAIVGAGLQRDVAMITDGRFSGGSHGFIIGHIAPEAQLGGPIALVKDGDQISIDTVKAMIELCISDKEWIERRRLWQQPALKVSSGLLYKYAQQVSSAAQGCITDA